MSGKGDKFVKFGRSARNRDDQDKHFYPDSETLINLANIQDHDTLQKFEKGAVAEAAQRREPMMEFSYEEFKTVHHQLFGKVYEWAGEPRDYITGRGEAPFCFPELIDHNMERIFGELKSDNHLRGLNPDAFAERAAYYMNEINAVHPFIEGNGRTSRELLKDLAEQAGHEFDMTKLTRESWYHAAKEGFDRQDHAPMKACISSALLERERIKTQEVDTPERERDFE